MVPAAWPYLQLPIEVACSGLAFHLSAAQVARAGALLVQVACADMALVQIAGVEDEQEPAPAPKKASSVSGNQWAQQLEKSYASSGGGSVRRASEPRNERSTMVSIVGYNQDAPGRAAAQQPSRHEDYNPGSSFGYDNIAGVCKEHVLLGKC